MENKILVMVFVVFIWGIILGGYLEYIILRNNWQSLLIEKNIAEYNSVTGDWQFKRESK